MTVDRITSSDTSNATDIRYAYPFCATSPAEAEFKKGRGYDIVRRFVPEHLFASREEAIAQHRSGSLAVLCEVKIMGDPDDRGRLPFQVVRIMKP